MQETPMLFPVSPTEFWKQIKLMMEEVVDAKLSSSISTEKRAGDLPEKTLLKLAEVCTLFRVSKPTLYEWMKQEKLKSFKIRSRRYFSRVDIEALISQLSH
jgi:excisionase family DNA binding protein